MKSLTAAIANFQLPNFEWWHKSEIKDRHAVLSAYLVTVFYM